MQTRLGKDLIEDKADELKPGSTALNQTKKLS